MSLTANDFPNQAAYQAYLASLSSSAPSAPSRNRDSTGRIITPTRNDSTRTSTSSTRGDGGGGGGGGSTRGGGGGGGSPAPPITPPLESPVGEGSEEEDAESAYWRRIRELAEEAAKRNAESNVFSPREDARDVIRRVLSQYRLESLTEVVWGKYASQSINLDDDAALVYSIREEEAYKKRFAANAARVAKGLSELLPSSYIELEDTYRRVLANNGMPPGFYDSDDDFTEFIANDVSVQELQNRLQLGYRLVADADPEVRNKMRELYGVSEGELAAYFIDPKRARPLMVAADYQRQARAAQIAARAQEQAGIRLSGGLAEDLARRGVTSEEAQAGFSEIGALGELRQRFSGEDELSEEDIVGGRFGINVAATQQLDVRKRRRVSEFTGGGSFARTTGATSGSTRLAVGGAE